jgi:hypothetical protein
MLRDSYGRKVDYLRLSVTDRCDLRCVYCMPPEGIVSLPGVREARNGEPAAAVSAKPEGHDLCGSGDTPSAAEPMSRVGG